MLQPVRKPPCTIVFPLQASRHDTVVMDSRKITALADHALLSSWKARNFGLTNQENCPNVLYIPQNSIAGLQASHVTDTIGILCTFFCSYWRQSIGDWFSASPIGCLFPGFEESQSVSKSMRGLGDSSIHD